MKKKILISLSVILSLVFILLIYLFFFNKDNDNEIKELKPDSVSTEIILTNSEYEKFLRDYTNKEIEHDGFFYGEDGSKCYFYYILDNEYNTISLNNFRIDLYVTENGKGISELTESNYYGTFPISNASNSKDFEILIDKINSLLDDKPYFISVTNRNNADFDFMSKTYNRFEDIPADELQYIFDKQCTLEVFYKTSDVTSATACIRKDEDSGELFVSILSIYYPLT